MHAHAHALALAHAQRVGRHARTHHSHGRHAHNYAMLLLVRHYGLRLQPKQRCNYYITTRLQTVARGRRSSSSSSFYTTGRREACCDWWRRFPVDGDTADSQLIPVRWSARAPLRPPAYAAAQCLLLVRPTFMEGLPPDVREYAHTNTHCRSVFDLNTMATRVYIIIIIDIYYSLHITLISYIHYTCIYRQTLQWRVWIPT